MATLSGTGLVADDLYLMAHDDVTGRPCLQPRALSLGLAGGLLAELLLADVLGLWRGLIVVTGAGVPRGRLASDVLGLVVSEGEKHPVCDWLAFLARTAAAQVPVRLADAGYLQKAWSRRPRRAAQWVPTDSDCAFAALSRARPALESAGPSLYSTVLAGLAVGCGLGTRLLPYGPPDARSRLREVIALLAPGLRELIVQTGAAVDKAVLSHRI
jgi:Golgi phosphoprotein 3 (GPP34)